MRFLESSKHFVVCSYGQGLQEFRVKGMEFKVKHSEKLMPDTKINCLVRLKKTKWLAFDWDSRRYIVWDKKRRSFKVINAIGDDGCVVCGEKLSVRHPFGMQQRDKTIEFNTFPMVLSKTERGVFALNYQNHQQI